jgi:hypothetical protein
MAVDQGTKFPETLWANVVVSSRFSYGIYHPESKEGGGLCGPERTSLFGSNVRQARSVFRTASAKTEHRPDSSLAENPWGFRA